MSAYIGNIPVPQATQTRQTFTATSGQTTFNTVGYTAGFVDVYMNGVRLVDGTDFTATNGSTVVLTTGAAASDVVEVVAYSTYEVNSQNYTGGLTVDNDGATVLTVDRATSDGTIIDVQKDGSTVGSIAAIGGDLIIFSTATGHSGLRFASTYVGPTDNSGTSVDNIFDMGAAVYRWDDIYATNGTIQTSDANEKQQIASLTDAEITAAKAISKLFKTFKWNDSVAEKGDAARTHTGVIAQEVEAAMTAAGLNAGDYAFFISSDWTDEETGEERNRKGIRYPQLMSFIGAATEQRLASIEARLDALEGN